MNFTPPASSITRRRLLTGAATVAVASLLDSCSASQSAGSTTTTTATTSTQPIPSGTSLASTLAVSTQAVGTIPSLFLGLSYPLYSITEKLFAATETNLLGLMQRLGPGVLRIGAIPEDQYVWNPTGAGGVSGQIAPADIDVMAAFIKKAGWQIIYGINLEGYPPSGISLKSGIPATTPALAAAEVAYAVTAFGSSLLGIEIGNEPDNYGWTFTQYKTQWSSMRAAIVAVTPTAPITGPATGNNATTWTVPFGQYTTKAQINTLTQHYYISCGCAPALPSVTDLLTYPDTNLINNYLLPLQAGAAALGLPYRMAEANDYYTDYPTYGLQDSYASGLWVIDFLYTCAQYGAAGVNVFGGGDGPSFTPIADNNAGTVIGPRPEYYGMEMFALAGLGTIYATVLSTGSLNVSAFAVKTSSGAINLVINNKTSTNLSLTVSLPQTVHTATLIEMTQLTTGQTGPALTAAPITETVGDQSAGTTIQGSEVNPDGTFSVFPYIPYKLSSSGMQLTCYAPALSAVLVQTT